MQQADRALSATGTLASPGNEIEISASRRGLMLGLVAMTALASVPAAAAPSAFQRKLDECKAATAHLDSVPYEFGDVTYDCAYNRFDAAWDAMVEAEPSTWAEFVAKFETIAVEKDDVSVTDRQAEILLADCRRLLARGA